MGCRRRPRELILSQFSIDCWQNAFASGALPRTPLGGLQRPQTPSWKMLGHTPIRHPIPPPIRTNLRACSQPHPSIIRHDAVIKQSALILRWNFRKAHLDDFATQNTCKCHRNLQTQKSYNIEDAYCQFTSAIIKMAKQHIPRDHRKIPGWDNECDELADKHHAATTEQENTNCGNADEHLDSVRQERCIETVQAIDFTSSSRKAWSGVGLRRLTGKRISSPKCPSKLTRSPSNLLKTDAAYNEPRIHLRKKW